MAESVADASTVVSSQRRGRRAWLYPILAVGVAVAVGVAAYVVLTDHRSSSNGPVVLAPAGSFYTIPIGQFNGITFITGGPSVVNGTFYTSYGIVLYQMNTSQYLEFTKTLHIVGYEWTDNVSNNIVSSIDLSVDSGAWVLAFVNPSPVQTTSVAFYTNLVLTSQ